MVSFLEESSSDDEEEEEQEEKQQDQEQAPLTPPRENFPTLPGNLYYNLKNVIRLTIIKYSAESVRLSCKYTRT